MADGGEDLGEREREVLRAVVQEFIVSGQPVGSQHLARRPDIDVSPATVRNVMADLEALGYLDKPHTSAGRIPTDQGYRFFCDTLLRLRDPGPKERELIAQGLAQNTGVEDAIAEAGRLLHQLTHHAGVVLAPRAQSVVVERLELVRLRDDRVLAVLVGRGGQVQNKLVMLEQPLSADELLSASNFLNELLQKLERGGPATIDELHARIMSELEKKRAEADALAQRALTLGAAATAVPSQERVVIEGAGSLLAEPDADVQRVRALFQELDEKNKLLALLDRVQRARELQIFIGAESEFSMAGDVTVIATPYGDSGTVLGTVGVIGPTRMDYPRIIPLVSLTARALSQVLDSD